MEQRNDNFNAISWYYLFATRLQISMNNCSESSVLQKYQISKKCFAILKFLNYNSSRLLRFKNKHLIVLFNKSKGIKIKGVIFQKYFFA